MSESRRTRRLSLLMRVAVALVLAQEFQLTVGKPIARAQVVLGIGRAFAC
jgi:hypothetical protein